ncbi:MULTISPECIES: response regulator transcription factor [unclassified Streptomyces]|uniref:response regulator transcription factor n=1 Tax=unclassified Streptomyces TaxID=2593676 RepID=UPI002E2BBEB4|nr:response regulator transcription factor [Streptomyces sp. NBC_00223]
MIRILLAEKTRMIRGALATLLELEEDFAVVAQVDRGKNVVSAAKEHRPDVAIIDIDLPDVDGITVSARLKRIVPDCNILILTALADPQSLQWALEAQVSGYLLTDTPSNELAGAVRKVATGERLIDPQAALAVWRSMGNPLTRRETDVLRLAAGGADVLEIGRLLHLAKGTVRNYLTTAVAKLNARNRLDAVRIAQEAGWLRGFDPALAPPPPPFPAEDETGGRGR